MLSNWFFPRGNAYLQAVPPTADMSLGAITGKWASLRDCVDLIIIVYLNTVAEDAAGPVLALQQAKNAAGGSAKVLNITSVAIAHAADINAEGTEWDFQEAINRGASVATLATDALGANEEDEEFVAVIRVHRDDLDGENGFTHVRLNSAALAQDRAGHVAYLSDMRLNRGSTDGGL